MATDYEKFYQENPHGLGEPTREFTTFFDSYDGSSANVLDVGCGQGRDAIFIARLGHHVTAIDISPTGINNLLADAAAEGLSIVGKVADIRTCIWQGKFDVILIDRTLHMLDSDDRIAILRDLLNHTADGAHILIADERTNIPALKAVFVDSKINWNAIFSQRGFLFMRKSLSS